MRLFKSCSSTFGNLYILKVAGSKHQSELFLEQLNYYFSNLFIAGMLDPLTVEFISKMRYH